MNLTVKKNYLYYENEKVPCAIGKNGISRNKLEGDGCTPIGEYKFDKILYRRDKLGEINFKIESFDISQDDGWCDDPNSIYYNQLIRFPFKESAEHLYRDDDIYDIVCVLNYNTSPVVPNKGSAIFLHAAHFDYRGTAGCIAVKLKTLRTIAEKIVPGSSIIIYS